MRSMHTLCSRDLPDTEDEPGEGKRGALCALGGLPDTYSSSERGRESLRLRRLKLDWRPSSNSSFRCPGTIR